MTNEMTHPSGSFGFRPSDDGYVFWTDSAVPSAPRFGHCGGGTSATFLPTIEDAQRTYERWCDQFGS